MGPGVIVCVTGSWPDSVAWYLLVNDGQRRADPQRHAKLSCSEDVWIWRKSGASFWARSFLHTRSENEVATKVDSLRITCCHQTFHFHPQRNAQRRWRKVGPLSWIGVGRLVRRRECSMGPTSYFNSNFITSS